MFCYPINCSFGDFPATPKLSISSEKLIKAGFTFKYGIEEIYDETVEYFKSVGLLAEWGTSLSTFSRALASLVSVDVSFHKCWTAFGLGKLSVISYCLLSKGQLFTVVSTLCYFLFHLYSIVGLASNIWRYRLALIIS